MSKTYSKTRILVECALMIAMGTVLSNIKFFTMPNGGSVTLLSMLPFVLVSFRHGAKWGLFTGFVNACLQMMLGFWAPPTPTFIYFLGEVLLDYVLAFTALGLAWYVAKPFPAARAGRAAGAGTAALVVCVLRYVCSVLSGYVVWKDYDYAFEWMTNFGWGQTIAGMGENALCWLYSAVYNATYMIPETLVTVGAAVVLALAAPKLFDSRAKL